LRRGLKQKSFPSKGGRGDHGVVGLGEGGQGGKNETRKKGRFPNEREFSPWSGGGGIEPGSPCKGGGELGAEKENTAGKLKRSFRAEEEAIPRGGNPKRWPLQRILCIGEGEM